MAEITFISNKTRKDINKCLFACFISVILWILQTAILGRQFIFGSSPNLLLISSIFMGLTLGLIPGITFGIISSLLVSYTLYDHIFYFSYVIVSIIACIFTKNIFSSELFFFTLLSFLLTFPFEFLNGWQFSQNKSFNLIEEYILISSTEAILNMFFAPLFYLLMKFVTNKLKLS